MTHTLQWRAIVEWPRPATNNHPRQNALVRALPGFGFGIAIDDGQRLRAEMTVTAATLRRAADAALQAARAAHTTAYGDAGEPVHLRVLTVDDHDAEISQPAAQNLVGLKEAGAILGVSHQRVAQLARDHPDFPAPVAVLGQGSVWTRASIDAFHQRWERRTGRPRKSARPSAPADD